MKHYSDVVNKYCKPAEEILGTLTVRKMHLTHMCFGLATECAEIQEIITEWPSRECRTKLIKELGDLEFYLEGLGVGGRIEILSYTPRQHSLPELGVDLHTIVGSLITLIKNHIVYEACLTNDDMRDVLYNVDYYLESIMHQIKITREEVLEINKNKLDKRFGNVEYTNEAALAQRDKNDE